MDLATLGLVVACVSAAGGVVAGIKFWMELGAALHRAETAATTAAAAVGRNELLAREFSDYKVESAEKFASFKALAATEARISASVAASEARIATSVDGFRDDFKGMSGRLDRFCETLGGNK